MGAKRPLRLGFLYFAWSFVSNLTDVWPQEKFTIGQNSKRLTQNDLVFQKEIRNPPIKIQRKKGGDAL